MSLTKICACALLSLAVTACSSGGGSTTPSVTGILPAATQLALSIQKPPQVAGNYAGSYSETQGGQTVTGTVTIGIVQSGSKISGPFDITIQNRTADLTLTGTVSAGKVGAILKFTILNPHGRNAKAHATVIGTALNGTAHVARQGSQKAVSITYKTIKTS